MSERRHADAADADDRGHAFAPAFARNVSTTNANNGTRQISRQHRRTRHPFIVARGIDVERLEAAEELNDQREPDAGLGRLQRQDQYEHDLAVRAAPARAGDDERERGRIHHDFGGHQHEQQIAAQHEPAVTEREQRRRQQQAVFHRNRLQRTHGS